MSDINNLLETMQALRDPESGCPWDIEQDFRSIAPYTIEEAYEVADAISRDDMPGLRSELGDLLFQVVFHARMAEEAALSLNSLPQSSTGRLDVIRVLFLFEYRFSIISRRSSAAS